jgi:hypothetical protein
MDLLPVSSPRPGPQHPPRWPHIFMTVDDTMQRFRPAPSAWACVELFVGLTTAFPHYADTIGCGLATRLTFAGRRSGLEPTVRRLSANLSREHLQRCCVRRL